MEFLHAYLTQPTNTPKDRILHIIHFLSSTLKYFPSTLWDSQLAAIDAIRNIFSKWSTNETHTLPKVHRPRPFTKKVKKRIRNHVRWINNQLPNQHWELRVHPLPRVPILKKAYQPPRVFRNNQLELIHDHKSLPLHAFLPTYNMMLLWPPVQSPNCELRILSLRQEHKRRQQITWLTITQLSLY